MANTTTSPLPSSPPDEDDVYFMNLALSLARKSPPKPTNFCVGACLVAPPHPRPTSPGDIPQQSSPQRGGNERDQRLLATGFTLECPGNTHAEQCCFINLAAVHNCSYSSSFSSSDDKEDDKGPTELAERILQLTAGEGATLYTTMEPCNRRSVGNTPCVERILRLRGANGRHAVRRVGVGVSEPGTFVGVNEGAARLLQAGIYVFRVQGFEEEILRVATAGHERRTEGG